MHLVYWMEQHSAKMMDSSLVDSKVKNLAKKKDRHLVMPMVKHWETNLVMSLESKLGR
jgi:hypothetical protein